ncbi:MAG: fasciclin domain-containing protein [Prevotella sp.]|nr:fasciclin domain-containing protein [Prevotella sp.]
MRRKTILKGIVGGLLFAMLTPLNTLILTSCSDEPDSEYFYTFTGEMMSDYLKSPDRPQYSEFAAIVERAGLMDLLSTYGHYTCFVPSNDAINAFLQKRGLSDVSQLSDADCDTIARTHLVNNMYTTYDMIGTKLPTVNMMSRYIATSAGFDNDSNAVIMLEGLAHIYFDLKDDSVENGIMQPIDMVIEKSNSYISDLMRDNPKISTFYKALVATGVINDVMLVDDPDYNPKAYEPYYKGSGEYFTNLEKFVVPETKKYGYTFFIEPDEVLESKYGIAKGDIHALYEKACEIYDKVYPQDVNAPGHSFENLTDSVNPLRRFIQYHILNKITGGTDDLTPLEITNKAGFEGAIGIDETLINPCDWHYTLLPHTMIKVDKVTVDKYLGGSIKGQRYINRRYDNTYSFEGQKIDDMTNETTYNYDGLNGHYFYVDDIVAFSEDVQEKVHNVRIRMDFNTIFPEFIGNSLRILGDPFQDGVEEKYGPNWYFPAGYLDGVTFSNCVLLWRRPHSLADIYQWDEFNLFGNYDITFRLPPVPFDGEWQIRLGFTSQTTRGVAQLYIDGIPQGIPLDMTKSLTSEMYLGSDGFINSLSDYDNMSAEEKAEYQKTLKNLGAYTYPRSLYCNNGNSGNRGYDITYDISIRRIISQMYLDSSQDHYLRIRVASDGKQGNDNEFALDFLELVPKSVYGGDGENEMEDDL